LDLLARVRDLCAVIRCSEIDDIDALALVTPGAVVVPVAVVLADQSGADGPALLAAVTAGYEAMITLGEGLNGSGLLARGLWPTYLLAPAAAAATAASLWGFDAQRTAEALAIALARAAGVAGRPPREPTSRWWLCGCAAVDGVLSAQAAASGLAGDPGLLERGLGADGALNFDSARLRSGDPVRLELVDAKPFCSARQVLPAIQAAMAIRERIGDRAIEAVSVEVPAAYRAMVDRPAPTDRTSSLQSAQFQVAAALSGDPVLYDPIRASPTLGAVAQSWMEATSVRAARDLSARYPAIWSARLSVRLGDGQMQSELVEEAPGTRLQSGWDELLAKYIRAGSDPAQAEALLGACQNLGSAGPACAGPLLSRMSVGEGS
jgi:2-methylcitrate dehydratase PrpD